MERQGQRKHRLVLVPCPFQGHITPMLQLGSALHSKGFHITIAHTIFNSPNPSEFPDFDFLPMPDGLSDPHVSSRNFISAITRFNINCEAPLQESLERITGIGDRQDKIACIIYDEYMYFSSKVASHLHIPSLVLTTSSAANALSYNAIPRLVKEGFVSLQDSQELVPDLQPLRFKDLPISNFKGLDDLLQLIAESRNTASSSAVIWNTMDCVEQSSLEQLRKEYQIPLFPIGPMHKIVPPSRSSLMEEDHSCISWLDKQMKDSVIYVSLGSIAFMDKKELAEMAWGLFNSKQPFLWVVRTDSCDELPEDFRRIVGERGRIIKWATQKQVLAHRAVGGFWSHCGWNSTLESISEGVPMICQPCFGDQRVNARYLSQVWRVGLEWDNDLERNQVEKAITRLMVSEEGKELRKKAMELKKNIEISVKQGGSSFNSLNDLVNLILSF